MKDDKDSIPESGHDTVSATDVDDHTPLPRRTPSPRDLMRIRHPDLFPDTRIDNVPRLAQEVFEYYLETLTNRKQEYEFEHFCRKLGERELCPNLRLQTGPTGGGDSKVDSETYPVAEDIAERWWIGSPAAGKELWAFAFSAKKDWKTKVKADVKNILSTGRNYKLIYFFSNQFVRDKDRSQHEDTLSKDAGIPVHIMDRTWIVAKVYEADSERLEIYLSALGIEDVQRDKVVRKGPRDVARLEELEELDQQVADPSRYKDARYQLVEDCLRSAILARSLERPRSEVESRFTRADRLAQIVSYNQQRLRVAYNRAWTAFWWYEDYSEFSRFYDEVEELTADSVQAHDAGLLVNLWMLLLPSIAEGRITNQEANLEARSMQLSSMLEKLVADSTRPNNALEARTNLILMRSVQAYHDHRRDEVEQGWRDLEEVVDQSHNLGAYSVEHLYDLVRELGEHVDSPTFDALYDKLADTIRKRRSDGEAGEAYSQRGSQKLQNGNPYEAIQWFGRAEELLVKDEYRTELTVMLLRSSFAYQRVGLLWAARNKALASVERNLAAFSGEGKLIPYALITLRRLVWTELQLGRIPHVLSAIALADAVASHMSLADGQRDDYADERWEQDAILGMHFLNLPLDKLSSVTGLPDTLQRLGLENARMALLFALGHERALREEGYLPPDEDTEAVRTLFEQWREQPAAKDIAPYPVLIEGTTSILTSTILGSEIVVEVPNNLVSFGLAESLLGALEAFLSTSNDEDVFAHRERMTIVMTPSDHVQGPPQITFPDGDGGRLEVVHPPDLRFTTLAEHHAYMNWLRDSLVQISCRILTIPDPEAWMEKVAGRERGLSRSLTLGDALALDRNLFGETPQICLTDWLEKNDRDYPVVRADPWQKDKAGASIQTPKFGTHAPRMIDKQQLKHTDRDIRSPIDIPLWNQAKWRGILFLWSDGAPPVFALAFEDEKAGQAIFRAWRDRWGAEDKKDALRVVVVTGVSKQNPAEYAVIVGPNLQYMAGDEKKLVTLVSRFHRMSPATSTNLDNFLTCYKQIGCFFLAPAWMNATGQLLREPSSDLAILKQELCVREAWQIGETDPDMSALNETDEPIVPPNVTDPPFVKALMRIQSFRQQRKGRDD